MPPVMPSRMRATGTVCPSRSANSRRETGGGAGILGRSEDELAPRDLFHRHRQVVLRARLDERRRSLLEAHALTELVVIVVDLTSALRGHDHEGVSRASPRATRADRRCVVRSSADHGTCELELPFDDRHEHPRRARRRRRSAPCSGTGAPARAVARASSIRSPISPVDSVARSLSRRSSSGDVGGDEDRHAPATSSWTRTAPSSSSSSTQTRPSSAMRSISERSVP